MKYIFLLKIYQKEFCFKYYICAFNFLIFINSYFQLVKSNFKSNIIYYCVFKILRQILK